VRLYWGFVVLDVVFGVVKVVSRMVKGGQEAASKSAIEPHF
jgi:hypothetical protein